MIVMTPRQAAGLTWHPDDDGAWVAEDDAGLYRLVEVGPGEWTDSWHPRVENCGCGVPPQGGRDFGDFETAAEAVVALGHQALK